MYKIGYDFWDRSEIRSRNRTFWSRIVKDYKKRALATHPCEKIQESIIPGVIRIQQPVEIRWHRNRIRFFFFLSLYLLREQLKIGFNSAGYSVLRSQSKDSLCCRAAWLSWFVEVGREAIFTSQRSSQGQWSQERWGRLLVGLWALLFWTSQEINH